MITAVAVLALTTALSGCGSDDAQPAASTSSPDATPAATAKPSTKTSATPTSDAVAINITIDGKKVDPAPSRTKVPVNSKVRLTVSSDVANEIHVHGYEIYKDVTPGKPAVITFKADQKGLFEVETHESPVLILGQLQVQ
jgi:hypothetical protein